MLTQKYRDLLELFYAKRCTKRDFLDALYNNFGPFSVFIHNQDSEMTSKWHDWMDIREKSTFVKFCNHRTCPFPEVVFDIDLPSWLTPKARELQLGLVLSRLHDLSITPVVVDTHKGYHLHYFCDELARIMGSNKHPMQTRREILTKIIKDVRTDLNLAKDKGPISLEVESHWKRGVYPRIWSYEATMGLIRAYKQVIAEEDAKPKKEEE